jgi:hypothetical protein
MAGRSQHPVQTMENQTHFDLNAAIENWRAELAAQTNLTADDRRELETHLRDTIAALRQRGLNDEETFWLARRRIGQPQQLGEEFVKENPTKIWRERIFWMAILILAIQLWTQTVSFFWFLFRNRFFDSLSDLLSPPAVLNLFPLLSSESISRLLPLFSFALIVGFFAFLLRKRLNQFLGKFQFIFKSRLRFLLVFFAIFSGYFLLLVNFALESSLSELLYAKPPEILCTLAFEYALFPIVLAILIAWLMPTQNRKTPKRA